jgi:predicted TIM-barrel fold metal-dependent hydrolase
MTMALADLEGRVCDLDSHEQVPVDLYGEVFGERGQRFTDMASDHMKRRHAEHAGYFGPDAKEITKETVWEIKGTAAPGVIDFDRRLEVIDMMGIHRQLVFPTFATIAFAYVHVPTATPEQIKICLDAVAAYHEWASEVARKYGDRLRMVGAVASGKPGATPEGMVKEAEDVLGMGMSAILMSSGRPPAGLSPAHPDLDPFYATLEAANVPLVFHVGASPMGFRSSEAWQNLPEFRGYGADDVRDGRDELIGSPVDITTVGMAEQNFFATMVLGGVFERHPNLRVGAMEVGSAWVGPLGELMDLATSPDRHHRDKAKPLSMRPSEYLNRNLRVTPRIWEPVEKYVERYPGLTDVYAYTSDYPHAEGVQYSMKRFYDRFAHLGDDFLEKFFVTNPSWLLP